jgi:hypothetical protein
MARSGSARRRETVNHKKAQETQRAQNAEGKEQGKRIGVLSSFVSFCAFCVFCASCGEKRGHQSKAPVTSFGLGSAVESYGSASMLKKNLNEPEFWTPKRSCRLTLAPAANGVPSTIVALLLKPPPKG